MEGADFNVVLPASASYPPPASLPQGMKQFTLRQVQYNTIPNAQPSGTPGGTEIQVVIPQLDGCFLDPSTTALYVECVYTGSMTIAAGNPVVFSCSNSNGGFVGSGASMFFRYQVWLNNSILSDNIDEFGLVCHLQFLLALTEQQRYELAVPLGFNKAYPASTWGAGFHCTDLTSRATLTPSGHVIAAGTANTVMGINATASTAYNSPAGVFWAMPNSTTTPPDAAITLTYMQNYNFMLQLPGLLGSGNDKLFPLFNGPTRLSLFMEDISRYYVLDYAAGVTSFTVAQPVPFRTMSGYMAVNTVWFVGDCCRCDINSFNAVLGSLPIPNTFIIRSTAWSVSSAALTVGQSGQTDVLIPPRRASLKAVYILPSPNGTNTDLATQPINLWGKYGWCNPNLTNGTCISLNGVNYPQQTTDPMNRPSEIWYNLLKTVQTWSNDANKTCIAPDNFYVCDSLANVTNGVNSVAFYGKAANNSSAGSCLWRPVNTTTFRCNIGAQTDGYHGFYGPSTAHCNNPGGGLSLAVGGANARIQAGRVVAMTDKSACVGSDTYGTVPTNAHFHEGSSSCDLFGPNSQYLLGGYAPSRPACNQFIYACDFENLAKQQYLSGISTLTGSFFFRLNIATGLKYGYSMYFVAVHDMLTILDTALRTAAVKI